MSGEQIDDKVDKDIVQTVTSVGNSWVVCRSKSHSGRIYYFNTLTGEAVWNLSDPEIEKAKNRTKYLPNQTGGVFEGCPEPKEPPMDPSPNNAPANKVYFPPRVYNKQIINNQFSKQTFTPIGSHCTNCNTHIIHSPLGSIGVNGNCPHNCTPNVWPIPPNHQIVIAPSTSSPLADRPPTSINMGSNNVDHERVYVQKTSLPLSRRFNLMQDRKFKKKNFIRGVSPYYKKFNCDSNDLRQKLSARRKSFNRWDEQTEDDHYPNRKNIPNISTNWNMQKIQIIRPAIDNITPSEADDDWLKENATLQGTQLVLNVSPLKKMVNPGNNATCWYVVADTYVLINHINLIKVIVNSDIECQLMVPDFIMEELQNMSRQSNAHVMKQAHLVLQILSQQFAAGCAVMGRDPANNSSNHEVFDFCLKLSQQIHDVVLVSNDIKLKDQRSMCDIPLFTISELKNLLTLNVAENPGRHFRLEAIKITVPNDIIIKTDNELPRSDDNSNDFTLQVNSVHNETVHKNVRKQVNKQNVSQNVVLTTKSTKDIGIQTDFDLDFSKVAQTKKTDKSTNTDCTRTDVNYALDNEIKRRGIQLKRNLSHNQVTDNNVEKKQFKWRRRKPPAPLESAPNNPSTDKPSAFNSTLWQDKLTFNETGNSSNNVDHTHREIYPEGERSYYGEPNDSSETGSSCIVRKNVSERVTIEETSTSGIISNSASNVDTESMHSVKPNEQIYNANVFEAKEKTKCAMFEVESPAMEESLKMRCDEWISRFVQIMEEVLTQLLEQNPPFYNKVLPPPWTLHEATECIKRKFQNDSDVVDAADKLTLVLFKISDGRGKIKLELNPNEYMEMYSYGVYLIDSLQTVLPTCEDLQTAADSLAKLLNDIVDPRGNVDAFMETSHVSDANVSNVSDVSPFSDGKGHEAALESAKFEEEVIKNANSQNATQGTPTGSSPNQKKYNLRSAQKTQPEKNEREQTNMEVKFTRNIDVVMEKNAESTFFSSLSLQKKNENDGTRKQLVFETESPTSDHSDDNSNSVQNKETNNEPKIIRNFSKCLEFEEKLKNRSFTSSHTFSDEINNDHLNQYDYFDKEYEQYEKEEGEAPYDDENEYGDQLDTTSVDEYSKKMYDQITSTVLNEIQEAFLEVLNFCDQTRSELTDVTTLSSPRKFEIREKAEKARLNMDTLCKSLKGILFRESTNCQNNLLEVLKEAGIYLDVSKSEEYRNIILKYSSQANILLEAVNFVIEAVN